MASLMDVFGAATQAASPFLRHETGRLREMNDLRLRNDSARFAADAANFLRDRPYDGDFEKYLGEITGYADAWHDERAAAGGSPYYRRSVEAMRAQSLEQLRDHALREADKWRYQQNEADYAAERNRFSNVEGWDTETRLSAMMDAHEFHAARQGWNPVERARDKASIYGGLVERGLAIDPDKAATVRQAYDMLDGSMAELERATAGREGEDGALDRLVTGWRDRLGAAKGAARMAIWERNYGSLKAMDSEYKRIAHDAIRAGDYNLLLYAQRLYWEGSELRESALGNPAEFDHKNHKDEIAGMFPFIGGLFGERGSGSGRSDEIKKAAVTGKLKELLSEVVAGRGGEFGSVHDFRQKFKGILHQWAFDSGFYGGPQEDFEVEFADVFEQFYDFARDAVKESPEALSAVTMTEKYVKDLAGNNPRNATFMGKRHAGVGAHASAAIMSGLFDAIFEFDNRNPKQGGQAFYDAVTGMLGVVSAETVQALGHTGNAGDDALINAVEALENRHIMHTNEYGQVVTMPGPASEPGRTSRQVENARSVLGRRIAEAEGLDPEKLVAHHREDMPYEKDAAPEFQYDGGSRWYRLVVEGEGRNKKLALESRSGLNGEWGNRRILDSRAESREADREFSRHERERSGRIESGNRDAAGLAEMTSLPMPPEYRGRDDDIMLRHEFISRYGVERYREFVEGWHRERGRQLPEGFR
jgi:hypothetical protein